MHYIFLFSLHHNFSYTADLRNLGGKHTNVWVADSAVQKIPEVSNDRGARAENYEISEIMRTAYMQNVLLQINGAVGTRRLRRYDLWRSQFVRYQELQTGRGNQKFISFILSDVEKITEFEVKLFFQIRTRMQS